MKHPEINVHREIELRNLSRRKLTDEQVHAIRVGSRIEGRSNKSLAAEFGVDPATVSGILNGRTYTGAGSLTPKELETAKGIERAGR